MKPNIVDIISRYTQLKRLGPGYVGKCPFCGAIGVSDFKVSIQHQKYTCSKCGATGGMFQFLISLKAFSIEDALHEIKESFNIPFEGNYLDKGWNDYLKGTDFHMVLAAKTKKAGAFFEITESSRVKQPVSYTELATFIRCPLEYKLRYRDNELKYEPIGTSINVGRFLHSLASHLLKLPPDQRSRELIETRFREETTKKRNPEYLDELHRFQEPTILLLLQYFHNKTVSDKKPRFTSTFGSFVITGTADCLVNSSDGLQIIEFKEYDYRDFQEDIDVLTYLQLLFYYFGLEERDVFINKGAYCFFNNGTVNEVVFSNTIINEGRNYIQTKLREIFDCREFLPKLNSLCVSCGYKSECELHIGAKGRR